MLFTAGWLAGCAAAPEADPPEQAPGAPVEQDILGLDVQHAVAGDDWEVTVQGEMPPGSGWFMFWPFDGPQDGYGASHSVDLEPCLGEAEGAWGLWVRPQPVRGEGEWSMWFAARMQMIEAGHGSLGGGSGGGTSAGDLVGLIAALVLDEGACVDMRISGSNAERFGNLTPEFRSAPAAFAQYTINDPEPPLNPLRHEVGLDGWTHVHRLPHCATQIDDLPVVAAPDHLLYADIDFPNGYHARAGPGTTPSQAKWFGTFSGTAGPLEMDVKSPWPQECLVVVETQLVVPEFGQQTGYIDQRVERVLPPGTWMKTWG